MGAHGQRPREICGERAGKFTPTAAVKNPIFTLAAETQENGADDDTRPSRAGAD